MPNDQSKYFIDTTYQASLYSAKDLLRLPQVLVLNAMLGIGVGRQWVSASTSISQPCYAIQAVIDSTLSVLVDSTTKIVSSSTGLLTALAMSAGSTLYGNFTTCSVSTGLVCGFYKV